MELFKIVSIFHRVRKSADIVQIKLPRIISQITGVQVHTVELGAHCGAGCTPWSWGDSSPNVTEHGRVLTVLGTRELLCVLVIHGKKFHKSVT